MTRNDRDRPGVIAPPPLIFLVFILLGLGIDYYLLPLWSVPAWPATSIAGILLVLSLLLVGWAFATFRRAGTPVDPYRPATTVVRKGPFRFTRNPMYVALTMLHIATGLWLGSLWVLLMLVPAHLVLHHGVILREEAYLEKKFGHEYRRYRDQVGRWL